LRALLNEGQDLRALAAVRDPQAIEILWSHAAGDTVSLSIGATLDPSRCEPLPVTGVVVSKHDRHGFGRTVVFAIGRLKIVIVKGPAMVMRPSFYTEVGLSPWKADVVMVKNFFPFLMFFLPYNRKSIFVRTKGTTDFDAAFELTFDGPMHPRDAIDDWHDRDRQRRGLAAAPPSATAGAAHA
ncbi:MAG: MlrC C-terminal domain-containing protein, partial [Polyangiales bacterium]